MRELLSLQLRGHVCLGKMGKPVLSSQSSVAGPLAGSDLGSGVLAAVLSQRVLLGLREVGTCVQQLGTVGTPYLWDAASQALAGWRSSSQAVLGWTTMCLCRAQL